MKTTRRTMMMTMVTGAVLMSAGPTHALSPKGIIEKATRGQLPADERVDYNMVLVNKSNKKKVRALTIWYKQDTGNTDQNLLKFTAPADAAGIGLLTTQKPATDSDQWLYLPALRRVKRIVSSDRTGYFAQTDLTYQDLHVEELEDHNYALLGKGNVDGKECYKIEAKPKSKSIKRRSGYSKRHIWVDASIFVIRQIQYYDKRDRHTKTTVAKDFKKYGPVYRAKNIVIDNMDRKHKTYIALKNVEVNSGLPSSLFTTVKLEQ